MWDAEKKDVEKVGGKEAARILEFDVAAEKFTGRFWRYVFEQNGHAIGDFNMIDATSGLIIERDQRRRHRGQGLRRKAPDGPIASPTWRSSSASTRSSSATAMSAGPVRKIGFIDLMKITDPTTAKKPGGDDGVYDIPVHHHRERRPRRRDSYHRRRRQQPAVLVGPRPDKADDNEFVLLEVGDFLKAE